LLLLMLTKNAVIQGAAELGKNASPGGKLTALACHPTKKGKQSSVTNLYFYKHLAIMLKLEDIFLQNGELITAT
jgi:hypothetical protein